MEEERWIEIEQFSRYCVSNHGRVKNQLSGRIMRPITRIGGRVGVGLVHDTTGTQRNVFIDELVWDLFGDSDRKDFTVSNIDGDLNNNNIRNLCLVPRERYKLVRVRDINTNEIFESISEAARSIGVPPGRVAYAVRVPNRKVLGHRFEIVE